MIADNPKRAFLRYALQHSAKCACEYCFESGVSFKDANEQGTLPIIRQIHQQKIDIKQQIDLLQENNDTGPIDTLNGILKHLDHAESIARKQNKSSHVVWPASTFGGEIEARKFF